MDMKCLFLGVIFDRVAPELAADAGLTVAAEWQLRCAVHERVDPYGAGPDAAPDSNGGVDVAS